jgi:hypothetical protein
MAMAVVGVKDLTRADVLKIIYAKIIFFRRKCAEWTNEFPPSHVSAFTIEKNAD